MKRWLVLVLCWSVHGVCADIEIHRANPIEVHRADPLEVHRADPIEVFTAEPLRPYRAEELGVHTGGTLTPEPGVALSSFGPTRYAAPRGWSRLASKTAAVWAAPALEAGEGLLGLWPAARLDGDFGAWFARLCEALAPGDSRLQCSEPLTVERADGLPALLAVVGARQAGGGERWCWLEAVRAGEQVALVQLETRSATTLRRLASAATAFAAGLSLSAAPANVEVFAAASLADRARAGLPQPTAETAPLLEQLKTVSFSHPRDWRHSFKDGYTFFDLPTGGVLSNWPLRTVTDFDAWFARLAAAVPNGEELVKRTEPLRGLTADGDRCAGFLMRTRRSNGTERFRLLHAVYIAGRVQVFDFLASSYDSFTAALPALDTAFAGLRRNGDPTPPAPATPPTAFDTRVVGRWLAYIPGVYTPRPDGQGGTVGVGGPMGVLTIAADGSYVWTKQGRESARGQLAPYELPDRRPSDANRYYSVTDGSQSMYLYFDGSGLTCESKATRLYAMNAVRAK